MLVENVIEQGTMISVEIVLHKVRSCRFKHYYHRSLSTNWQSRISIVLVKYDMHIIQRDK